MTPLVALPFVINPVLGVIALSAISLAFFIVTASAKKTKVAEPIKPQQKALQILQKTENHTKKIATDTIKQKSILTATTATLNQNTKRMEHASKQLDASAKIIQDQTDNTQHLLRDFERIRRELAFTSAALKASQRMFEKQENSLSDVTQELQKTHLELKKTIHIQKEQTTKALHHAIRTGVKQKQTINALLEAKTLKIEALEKDIGQFRASMFKAEEKIQNALSSTSPAPKSSQANKTGKTPNQPQNPLGHQISKNHQTGASRVIA